ncbi:MAG: hypothetical protein A3G18_02405 [Rhodospirillales bacterium RIFCSPLOWO2_12_FULL_58_28]|nr:MAG: hypothetical protein A3H92_07045 [Rhodospirillales bacterium RIFCSPLOWO2_02_FULL_58_16]OHC78904.1 MAG: hypothetical protein A3G18_02405 [Rhodospirillales bacterium RIFCSPLOWO2_12_FULL_58_28]
MKRILIATVAAFLLTWGTIRFFSEDVAKEEKAAREVDFAARFSAMKPLAEKGEANAQFAVARLYHEGKGVDQNLKEAAGWYAKAAKSGHDGAQYYLGTMYEKGEGVSQDVFKAADWYKAAAGFRKNVDAQFALGQLYFNGRGVPQDYADAFSWYLKAAEGGHGAAQFLIASMYQDGWSVKSDPVEAYKWYTLAIPNARQAIAVNAKFDPSVAREKLIKRMNNFQIEEGKRKVEEWISKTNKTK